MGKPLKDVPPDLPRDGAVEQVRIIRRTIAEQMPEEALPACASGFGDGGVRLPDVLIDGRACVPGRHVSFSLSLDGPMEGQGRMVSLV